MAMESAGVFQGRYHVLHGVLSPIKGIGPDDLNLPTLVERVRAQEITEVIIATDVDVEGEATAAYIREILEAQVVTVTRIATGVPMGSDIEYLDGTTLARALMGRKAQF
jgi:recombination protein RecR